MRRALLAVVLLGCGPNVGSPDAAQTDSASTGGQGSDASTAATLPSSASSDVTTGLQPTTSAVDTGASESPSSTSGEPPVCVEEDFQGVRVKLESDVPFDVEDDCEVIDYLFGLDSAVMELDCEQTGPQEVRAGGFDVEDHLPPGTLVHLLAVGVPSEWSHLAIYDPGGDLLLGSYDLSPAASDVLDWFAPLQFTIVTSQCDPEPDDGCLKERIAVDFSDGVETVRIYDNNAGELAGYDLRLRAWIVHPAPGCRAATGLIGWFTVLRLP